MKGIVVYDSVYGNTEKVAEAIAEQIKNEGHQVEVRSLKKRHSIPQEGDFLFIGSPTRMGRMTNRSKNFARKLDRNVWKEKPIIAFDTILITPEDEKGRKKTTRWIEYGAAPRLHDLLKEKGLNAYTPVLRLEVEGVKGPLVPTALDDTRRYVHEFLLPFKG